MDSHGANVAVISVGEMLALTGTAKLTTSNRATNLLTSACRPFIFIHSFLFYWIGCAPALPASGQIINGTIKATSIKPIVNAFFPLSFLLRDCKRAGNKQAKPLAARRKALRRIVHMTTPS
jgi:hypothetical protein